ncbi:MFS transporter [Caedibacter taeniospiralis]|uniref:MFS transporter n=1 Tax=Caedibacter taeniospiralis TaxID=28907 RepID=UPI000C27BADA|nr:MFS transporter [Caedibacter taeniospiralis]
MKMAMILKTTNKTHLALFIWFLGAFFFFCEYFLRVSPSVMLPELSDRFSITAVGLGALSAFFYYPYILMQIPVGMITDKFGPKKVMMFAAFLTGIACIIFALAHSLTLAIVARMLMGFCGAFAFVGTLRLAINFFTPNIFAMLTGITQAMGMLGAAVGEAPMSLYVDQVGVSFAMLSFAGLFFVIGFLMLWLSRYIKAHHLHSAQQTPSLILHGVKEILRNKGLWANCIFIGCLYGPTTVFAEMWGASFTESFRGLTHADAAFTTSLIFIGMVFGCPLFGFLNSLCNALYLMRLSALFCLIFMIIIIYVPGLSTFELQMVYFCYGICNAGIIPSYNRSALLVPRHFSGISLGITNMFSVLLGAISIQIVGILIHITSTPEMQHAHQYPADIYQKIFILIIALFCVCLALSFKMQTIPSPADNNTIPVH